MDQYYVDGGVADNFPIIKGEEIGQKVLGIYLKISEKSLQDHPEDGIVYYFLRLLQIPIVQSTKRRVEQASEKCTIIPVDTGELRSSFEFDVKSKMRLEMFSTGYTAVKEHVIEACK
jgi:predicted patatin/cPLA2 family phospholipase